MRKIVVCLGVVLAATTATATTICLPSIGAGKLAVTWVKHGGFKYYNYEVYSNWTSNVACSLGTDDHCQFGLGESLSQLVSGVWYDRDSIRAHTSLSCGAQTSYTTGSIDWLTWSPGQYEMTAVFTCQQNSTTATVQFKLP